MKKETPAPEQHPVDAYFREQEAGIPVAFNPAHWDSLQAILDQANPDSVPASGTRVSDVTSNAAKPSLARFLSAVFIFVFLAAVPSANPANRQATLPSAQDLSATPEIGTNGNTQSSSFSKTPDEQMRSGEGTQASSGSKQTSPEWSLLPAPATTLPMGMDTVGRQFHSLGSLPLDSLYRQTDSLSIQKGLRAAQDSIAEQKKKKKHLFW